MALRSFTDSAGEEWRVWSVLPHSPVGVERRQDDRRRNSGDGYAGPERRRHERRVRTPTLLTPGLESGWLCFENHHDKRRLTPIPRGWEERPEAELEELCRQATSVTRRDGAG
ncbi:MAG TPA: hypothetical protein VFX98_18130 [Longimicrobiaceae bacterium]|nr:hypothetical protein [Longimicrobiaceae bacterium]